MRKSSTFVMASMFVSSTLFLSLLSSGAVADGGLINSDLNNSALNNRVKITDQLDNVISLMPAMQHMFEGVELTEQQRQQMRDLMRLGKNEQLDTDTAMANVAEIAALHKLITANNFNEQAVRTLLEKMSQEQLEHQVKMANVRNQMYRLLTPEQKRVLDQKYQQRMDYMHQQVSGMQQTSAQKLSMTE